MKHKLEWLELGRGIAALAVMLCHVHWYLVFTPDYLHFVWPWGFWAVQFFFVLSGFIIYLVNGDELGSGSGAVFARRRFIRIFPTYWLIFICALALRQFVGNPDYAVHVTPAFLATNLLMLPAHSLFINAAWSLRHELLFYGVFLVCIWNLRVGLALATAWLAAVLFASFEPVDETRTLWGVISSPMNLLFAVGVSLAALVRRFDMASFLAAGPPLSAWLGRISYPLYLCHMPTFLVVRGILKRTGGTDNWMVAAPLGITLSLLVATLIAVYFERPILVSRPRAKGQDGAAIKSG